MHTHETLRNSSDLVITIAQQGGDGKPIGWYLYLHAAILSFCLRGITESVGPA